MLNTRRVLTFFGILVGVFLWCARPAMAGDDAYTLTLKDHRFTPNVLTVPADLKITLTIKNMDSTPAEFESHDLRREKVVAGHSSIVLKVGPLKKGIYTFVDEFHEKTAKGKLIVQ
jgi:Cupredoxin-like domain